MHSSWDIAYIEFMGVVVAIQVQGTDVPIFIKLHLAPTPQIQSPSLF